MAIKAVKKRMKALDAIGPKLDELANNHFPHLQAAVEKVADKQERTNLELVEQTGFLRAIVEAVSKK